jgi:hypothetical protein
VFGRPVLKRIFNDLHDLAKVRTSTAEAFWQRVAGIIMAEFAPDAMPTDEQLAALDAAMQDIVHDLRRFVTGNFELKRLAETEPNPKEAAELYMTLIAAGATPPMPKRILFGSETGERSSTEDQKTWLGAIESRRQQVAEPRVLRPFIQACMDMGVLPRRTEYEIVWPTLYSVPEKDVAEANALRARAIKDLTPMAGDPTLLYEVDEDRNIWPVPRKADEASPFEIEPIEPGAAADEPPAMEEAA